MNLDKKDKEILELLIKNARISVAEISRQVHLARTTVQERIARLESKKIIKGYTTIVSQLDESSYLTAMVGLSVETKAFDDLVTTLQTIPEVTRCLATSGAYDLCLEVYVSNINKLESVLAMLGTLKGVNKTDSNIVLNSYFQR